MTHYKYLVIGGGMTANAAVRAIRNLDPNGSIGMVSREPDPPYKRPPLTKGLWKGKKFESIWLKTEDLDIEVHLGRVIKTLDPKGKSVTDDQAQLHTYDRLLLATGGAPRKFPFEGKQVNYYRTVRDYQRLREQAEKGGRFAVVGAGFIGSEIAAALTMNGKQVVMIFPGEGIGGRLFPAELSLFLGNYYREKGVEIWTKETLKGLKSAGEAVSIETVTNRTDQVDGVVAGLGTQPNVELAGMAGLKLDGGILVDEYLRTNEPDIYAAGDVAVFYNPILGKRLRVEHEDNANTMGEFAGRNMAGESVPYHHIPFFYSDLFELGYEAVGEVDSRLDMVPDWKNPYTEGVVYYLRDKRVRGVLLWNVWDQVEAARRLIAEPGPFSPRDLKGRLPNPG